MENQPQPHKARRKNSQPVRSTTGTSSQPPQDPEAQKSTSATQTTVPATPTTRATEKEAAPSPPAYPLGDLSEIEKVVREFLATLGPEEKPSNVLLKMAETFRLQEEASRLTPLYIPPRPSSIQETASIQEISSITQPQATEPLSAATHEENTPSTSIPVTNPLHAGGEYTVEEAERAGKGCEIERSAGEDVVGEEVAEGQDINAADDEEEKSSEEGTGDKPDVNDDDAEGSEEGAGDKPDVDVDIEGETPAVDVEGETPEKIVEGETPEKVVEGETPVVTEEMSPDKGNLP